MTSTFDSSAPLTMLGEATDRFLASIESLSAGELAAPSLLPGWSRGHVCAHVAGNADSLVNLLTSARTGQVIPQYPSQEARDAAIEQGALRAPLEHVAAVRESAERFVAAAAALPADAWHAVVEWRGGVRRPASGILWARLREVEIHHVDLGLAYTPAHWPEGFSGHVLGNVAESFRALDPAPPFDLHAVDTDAHWSLGSAAAVVVSGPQAALLAWLIGRSSGDGLTAHGRDGEPVALPVPPPWL